jgi:hypothetical protein
MRRWSPLFLILVAASASALEFGPPARLADIARVDYARFAVRVIVPDGNGGSVAFGRMGKSDNRNADIVATPIDADGTPHPERAVMIAANASADSSVGAAKTPAGYLVSFGDVEMDGYVVVLNNNLSVVAPLLSVPNEELRRLACSGAVCAAVADGALLLIDPTGKLLGRVTIPGARTLTAIAGGFAVGAVHPTSPSSSTTGEVLFIDGEGKITGSAPLAGGSYRFDSPAIAPHALGAAVFWGSENQIRGAVVRTDGTIVSTATLPGGGIHVAEISAAANASGQMSLVFSSDVSYILCTCPPVYAVYAMRVSDALAPLTTPSLLSNEYLDNTTSSGPVVAAIGNDFIAGWQHSTLQSFGSRILRIPSAGLVIAGASLPLDVAPASQTGLGVAASADRTLALWSSPALNGKTRLYATRFDRFGTRVDATPITVADSLFGAVASDGRDFMINIGSKLVSVDGGNGTVRAAGSVVPGMTPYIVWDGGGYVLPTYDAGFKLTRVAPDGTLLWSKPLSFPNPAGFAAIPGRTLVVTSQASTIHYQLFDTAGNIVATNAIFAPPWSYPIDVVSNGRDQFLLLLDHYPFVYAARIAGDGTPVDPVAVSAGPSGAAAVAVASAGRWLLFLNDQVIGFPGLARQTALAAEWAVDAAITGSGRPALLTQRFELIDGVSVRVLSLWEILDSGASAPRRRSVKR